MEKKNFKNYYLGKFVSGKGLQDKMGFGKYKECRIEFCIDNMPDYVDWAVRAGYLSINQEGRERLNASLDNWKKRRDIGTRVHRRYEDKTEDVFDRFTRYKRNDIRRKGDF